MQTGEARCRQGGEQGDNGQRSVSRWWVSPAEKYVLWYDFSDSNGKANRARVTSVKR